MSKLAELYASEIIAGRKKITQVPSMLKKQVEELLAKSPSALSTAEDAVRKKS